MSAGIITNAGRALLADSAANESALIIDRFIFANVPELDIEAPANPDEQVQAEYVVHETGVTQNGYVTPDKVVYSVFLGADVGDFTFNWVGLLSENNTLVAVRYIDPVEKFKTQGTRLGNAMTRNFMVTYQDVTNLTGITVDASTWQLQFDAASEEHRGLVELATQAETNAGVSDDRVVTPSKLAGSIVNNLTSQATARALSANQGRVLKANVDTINTLIAQLNTAITEANESIESLSEGTDFRFQTVNNQISTVQESVNDNSREVFQLSTAFDNHNHDITNLNGQLPVSKLPRATREEIGGSYWPTIGSGETSGRWICNNTGFSIHLSTIEISPGTSYSPSSPLYRNPPMFFVEPFAYEGNRPRLTLKRVGSGGVSIKNEESYTVFVHVLQLGFVTEFGNDAA